MKNKILLSVFAFLSLSVAMISCKKHKDDAATPTTSGGNGSTCMPSYVVSADDSIVFTYDAQSRLIKQEAYDNTHIFSGVIKYDYTSARVVKTEYDEHNLPLDTVYYYLNANGTAKYSTETDSSFNGSGFVGMEYDTIYYTYDSDGYNISQVTKSFFKGISNYDTTWFTYSGGNQVSATYSQGDVITYAYASNEDKLGIDIDPYIPGLLGKASKNLIASFKSADDSIHGSLIYQFDADGYVTRYGSTVVSYGDTDMYDYKVSKTCK